MEPTKGSLLSVATPYYKKADATHLSQVHLSGPERDVCEHSICSRSG